MIVSCRLILFVGTYDYANCCNRIARAINAHSAVFEARVVTWKRHPYGYDEDICLDDRSGIRGLEEAKDLGRRAEWVIDSGDGDWVNRALLLQTLGIRGGQRLAMTHAGTAFRDNPSRYRPRNEHAERVFVPCDLYRLVRDLPHARPYLAPFDGPGCRYVHAEGPLRVCHSPTDRGKKGTRRIRGELAEVRDIACLDLVEGVPPTEAVRRRAAADVYIDQWNSDMGGFGVSLVEAMAYGVPTLCSVNNIVPEVGQWIPQPPVCALSDNPRESVKYLVTALYHDRDMLRTYSDLAGRWAKEVASSQAVASYWERELA